jgi:RNA polymerase sigma factor (sigma-70 family)
MVSSISIFRRQEGLSVMDRTETPESDKNSGKVSTSLLQETPEASAVELARRKRVLETAFTESYRVLYSMLMAILRNKAFNLPVATCRDRVEDALQETYVRLMGKATDYDDTRPAGPWIRQIAYYALMEQSSSRQPKREARAGDLHAKGLTGLEELVNGFVDDASVAFYDQEQVDLIRQAAMQLPDDFRNVVLLTVFDGLTPAEVADRLSLAPGTVYVRKCRGLLLLKNILKDFGIGPEARDGSR